MNPIHRNERGFALATSILALVVVGALVTAGFYAASQEGRLGTSNAQADIAFYVAEQGLQAALGTVKKRDVVDLQTDSLLFDQVAVSVGGEEVGVYSVTIQPFGGEYYFLESVGEVTRGGRYAGARRRVGMVVRTMALRFPMNAALTSFGGIDLRGNALVSGVDTSPTDWETGGECDPEVATESGIRTTPGSDIDTGGSTTILGEPQIERDSTLDPTDFTDFGDIDLAQLRAMATHIIPGGSATPTPTFNGTICNRADAENWGDPTLPLNDCSDYFPIIYSDGGLSMASQGIGQGILIVDGDLSVAGHFEFYGIVIVTGVFNNQQGAGNAEIHGTLLTQSNADIDDVSLNKATPVLQFSTCTIERAIEENDALARLIPVQHRSWVDLTASGYEEN